MEVSGRVIEDLTFTDASLPPRARVRPGARDPVQHPRAQPRTTVGSCGCAIVAWAVEAHWDIQHDNDERISVLVPVAQHPDLLRAGVINLPAGAMFDSVADEMLR